MTFLFLKLRFNYLLGIEIFEDQMFGLLYICMYIMSVLGNDLMQGLSLHLGLQHHINTRSRLDLVVRVGDLQAHLYKKELDFLE